jgi:Zn-dependent M28 family amino/carboxypeptidase
MVLGACQQSAKPPVATIPPASASASAKSTAPAQAATSTVGATSSTAATRAATVRAPKKEKEQRTPALTDGAAPRPGGGEVLSGSVNVYTFDPEPSFTPVDAATVSLAHVLADLGADAAEWYQHVQTLSNPWFEGRAPGSEGIEFAAQYLAWWMQKYGLEPAFADGSAANSDNPWRQPFELGGGGRKITSSSLDLASAQLAPRSTVVMKNSGAGTIEVPFAFAGYGIVDGKDGYTSFAADTRFDGHAVLVLRGEPLDAEGKSLWGGDKFTSASSLAAKLDAIASRGAAAILVAEPPGYAGKKANLAAMSAESLGGALDIPCFFVNAEAADAISKACDPQSRDLATLRALADAGTKDAPALPVIGKPDAKLAIAVEIDRGNTVTHNVGGILRGKGALAGEWLVIGAHYDHVGYGAYGADPQNRGTVHPGADDNASGTSGMLLMAKRLAKRYADAPADASLRSVLFLGFSAEEIGLNGSRAWIKNASIPADKLDIMLNMDMIGRLRSKELVVGGVDSAHGLLDALTPMFIDSGLKISADPSGRGPSDHAPFYGAGVPVLFFFSGVHDVYHKPGDQGYSVDPRGIPAVLDLVERIALWRAAAGTKLDYWNGVRTQEPAKDPAQAAASAAPVGNDRGYAPVRLGIQPGLVESGESGIGVESVSEGTSAADAGIKPGDVLLAWNGESLDSVGTMMTKLRATKPGDVVKMRILRGNEELTIDVKMKASTAPRRPADE